MLGMQGCADAELAYARLEALCQAVKGELQQDLHIHDAAVLPNFVNLPQVTAAEYGRVRANPTHSTFAFVPSTHNIQTACQPTTWRFHSVCGQARLQQMHFGHFDIVVRSAVHGLAVHSDVLRSASAAPIPATHRQAAHLESSSESQCTRICSQMLVMDLTHTLEHFPPPQPSRSAVDLLVSVGRHQEYLAAHGLLPPKDHPGSLDALKVRPLLSLSCQDKTSQKVCVSFNAVSENCSPCPVPLVNLCRTSVY